LGKTALLGASYLVLFAKYNYNDEVKEDEMGRAFRINCGEEECI
jgi:hypothetical protein